MRKWGKWVSEIRMPNSRDRIWLGSYDTPEKAARAFDFAVYCLRGSKAEFNFPYSLPDIPYPSSLSPLQIQAAAAKFAAEEIWLPSGDNAVDIPYASSPYPPEIQAAAAKFPAEEFWLPSEDHAMSSYYCSKAESGVEGQEISVKQGPTFWDSVLEDLDSNDSVSLQDFSLLDVYMEDYGFLFPPNEECGPEAF